MIRKHFVIYLVATLFFVQQLCSLDYFYFKNSENTMYVSPEYVYDSFELEFYPRNSFYVGEDKWYHFFDHRILFGSDGRALGWYSDYLTGMIKMPLHDVDTMLIASEYADNALSAGEKGDYIVKATFKASSHLTEQTKKGTVVYDEKNLSLYFKTYHEYDEDEQLWDYTHVPWVEGVKGYGVGERIEAYFEDSIDSFVILNGYVDPDHPDYYKKNSRVKVLTVIDQDNRDLYEFTLEDTVREQRFYLNYQTKNLDFVIKEVYQGDKYQDTCITGLYGRLSENQMVCDEDGTQQITTVDAVQNEIKEEVGYAVEYHYDPAKVCTTFPQVTDDQFMLFEEWLCHEVPAPYDEPYVDWSIVENKDIKLYYTETDDFKVFSAKPIISVSFDVQGLRQKGTWNAEELFHGLDPRYAHRYYMNQSGENAYLWTAPLYLATGLTFTIHYADGTDYSYTTTKEDVAKMKAFAKSRIFHQK